MAKHIKASNAFEYLRSRKPTWEMASRYVLDDNSVRVLSKKHSTALDSNCCNIQSGLLVIGNNTNSRSRGRCALKEWHRSLWVCCLFCLFLSPSQLHCWCAKRWQEYLTPVLAWQRGMNEWHTLLIMDYSSQHAAEYLGPFTRLM